MALIRLEVALALVVMLSLPAVNLALAEQDAGVQAKLRQAVSNSIHRLGALDAMQKRIFEEEVLEDYSRFIKDYRPGPNGALSVEVDLENLRKYVQFHGARSVKHGNRKILVYVDPQKDCSKCESSREELVALLRNRLVRRMFEPEFVGTEVLLDQPLAMRPLIDRLSDLAIERNASGALLVRVRLAPVDSIDTAHREDKRYEVDTQFMIRGDREIRYGNRLGVNDDESFALATKRLLISAFSDFGDKVSRPRAGAETEQEELAIEVDGVSDFSHYSRVKAQIQERLKSLGVVEERRIARGKATFAVSGALRTEDARRSLASAPAGDTPVSLKVKSAEGRLILVEVEP